MKIRDFFQTAAGRLKAADIPDSEIEISILLEHVLKMDRVRLMLEGDREIPKESFDNFEQLLSRRLLREPLAYIIGEKEFWSLSFKVTPDVLIPRPETEFLIETVKRVLKGVGEEPVEMILDLGTGSGVIATVLALEFPDSAVYGIDRSKNAIKIACLNAKIHGVLGRTRFVVSDWFEAVRPAPIFDLIVSNPPYVAADTMEDLQPEVGLFEPGLALDGGEMGVEVIEVISSRIERVLKPGGWFFMEIGIGQDKYCMDRFSSFKYYDCIKVHNDYAGIPRIFHARKRNESWIK
ncbi:MAG: peptide chain release factor N(5)-glutamine methyltransferase [Thermodesulfobacteriota bacterium]|nr:peptide chain release factor N(5)-glutamine methyltransferase [Thermodesulfobacteriota bacterium]